MNRNIMAFKFYLQTMQDILMLMYIFLMIHK